MTDQEVQLSRMFAALADSTRRDLVRRLAGGDATLTDLASAYAMSVQAIAKHLRVLEDAGLVRRTSRGARRPCTLDADRLELLTGWIENRQREAEERYRRLDDLLDRMQHQQDGSGDRRDP